MQSTHEKTVKRATGWREYLDNGRRYRIRVSYGFESMNGPGRDHFSITGETEEFRGGWREDLGGCIHEEIVKHFPHLADLIPWHMTAEDGPLHYEANGMFWWDRIGKPKERPYDPDALTAFRSTVNYGALPDDDVSYPGNDPASADAVRAWLRNRHGRLMSAFWDTMRHHGLAT